MGSSEQAKTPKPWGEWGGDDLKLMVASLQNSHMSKTIPSAMQAKY